jgi:hypothetical protein
LYDEFEEDAGAVLVVLLLDEPGLFDDDGEPDDVDWDMDPASGCCAMLFFNPCIWMRLFGRLIVSCELALWGGEESRVGLSVRLLTAGATCACHLEIMKAIQRPGKRPRDVRIMGSALADVAEAREGRSLVALIGSYKGMEAYAG